MRVSRFFGFVGVIFIIALVTYMLSTPRGNEIQFTGIIMGNDYIASPLVTGRLQRLLVDEGSSVHTGELIAEIDPLELQAARDSAAANISTFRARLRQSRRDPHHGRPADRRRPSASGSRRHRRARATRAGQGGAGSERNHLRARRRPVPARRAGRAGAGHGRADLSRLAS